MITLAGRNDLELPAISLCPAIDEVLRELRAMPAELVRMSGSGATCFALFRRHDVMREAAEALGSRRREWWQMQGSLR
jgi:4-diphosphocytidyl-2-C-methyl-D-erythritol kinase